MLIDSFVWRDQNTNLAMYPPILESRSPVRQVWVCCSWMRGAAFPTHLGSTDTQGPRLLRIFWKKAMKWSGVSGIPMSRAVALGIKFLLQGWCRDHSHLPTGQNVFIKFLVLLPWGLDWYLRQPSLATTTPGKKICWVYIVFLQEDLLSYWLFLFLFYLFQPKNLLNLSRARNLSLKSERRIVTQTTFLFLKKARAGVKGKWDKTYLGLWSQSKKKI